jgi:hypothetical protein
MDERPAVYENRLQCEECGRVSRENERGWRAYLTIDERSPRRRSSIAVSVP